MWKEVKRNFILQQGFEEPAPAVHETVFGASIPTPSGVGVDRGGNLVPVPTSVLSSLCRFMVERSAPETKSLRCSVQRELQGCFLPYTGSRTPSHGASDGGHVCSGLWTTPPYRSPHSCVCDGRNLCSCRAGTSRGRLLPWFFRISPVERQGSLRVPNATLGETSRAR